jgi:hypothetical protein
LKKAIAGIISLSPEDLLFPSESLAAFPVTASNVILYVVLSPALTTASNISSALMPCKSALALRTAFIFLGNIAVI